MKKQTILKSASCFLGDTTFYFTSMYLLFMRCGFVKDVIHSNHLCKNGAITERVAQCSQPGGEIAQYSHNLLVGGGDDEEICIHVQDDGSNPYQIVQVGAPQTYQPVERRTQTTLQYYTVKPVYKGQHFFGLYRQVVAFSRSEV